jgi:hypothetical protein
MTSAIIYVAENSQARFPIARASITEGAFKRIEESCMGRGNGEEVDMTTYAPGALKRHSPKA